MMGCLLQSGHFVRQEYFSELVVDSADIKVCSLFLLYGEDVARTRVSGCAWWPFS